MSFENFYTIYFYFYSFLWCLIFRSFLQKSRCPRHIRLNQDYPVIAELNNYMCTKKTSLDMQLCTVQRWFSKPLIFEPRFLLTPCILWRSNRCKRISSSSRFDWYHAQSLTRNQLLCRQQTRSMMTQHVCNTFDFELYFVFLNSKLIMKFNLQIFRISNTGVLYTGCTPYFNTPFFEHFFEKFMFWFGTSFFNNPKKILIYWSKTVELIVNNYENLEI